MSGLIEWWAGVRARYAVAKTVAEKAALDHEKAKQDWRVWGTIKRYRVTTPDQTWTCAVHINDALKQAYLIDPNWDGWASNDENHCRELDYATLVTLNTTVPTGDPFER